MSGHTRLDSEEDLEYRREVDRLMAELSRFGISTWDLAVKRPRKWQHRELAKKAAVWLTRDSRLWESFREQGELPVHELQAGTGVGISFIEANRAYITALAVIMNGDYQCLREYVRPQVGGGFQDG